MRPISRAHSRKRLRGGHHAVLWCDVGAFFLLIHRPDISSVAANSNNTVTMTFRNNNKRKPSGVVGCTGMGEESVVGGERTRSETEGFMDQILRVMCDCHCTHSNSGFPVKFRPKGGTFECV
ncbi:hypothetical protein DMENIID0001_084200 [Sergentomyia squamirostris]